LLDEIWWVGIEWCRKVPSAPKNPALGSVPSRHGRSSQSEAPKGGADPGKGQNPLAGQKLYTEQNPARRQEETFASEAPKGGAKPKRNMGKYF